MGIDGIDLIPDIHVAPFWALGPPQGDTPLRLLATATSPAGSSLPGKGIQSVLSTCSLLKDVWTPEIVTAMDALLRSTLVSRLGASASLSSVFRTFHLDSVNTCAASLLPIIPSPVPLSPMPIRNTRFPPLSFSAYTLTPGPSSSPQALIAPLGELLAAATKTTATAVIVAP